VSDFDQRIQTDFGHLSCEATHFAHTDRRVGDARPQPDSEKVEETDRENETEDGKHRDPDKIKSIHGSNPIGSQRAHKALIAAR
jgi:hypothetical protein